MAADHGALAEGLCPNGHGPLERRDDHGWCETCKLGWSLAGRVVNVHLTGVVKSAVLHAGDAVQFSPTRVVVQVPCEPVMP